MSKRETIRQLGDAALSTMLKMLMRSYEPEQIVEELAGLLVDYARDVAVLTKNYDRSNALVDLALRLKGLEAEI